MKRCLLPLLLVLAVVAQSRTFAAPAVMTFEYLKTPGTSYTVTSAPQTEAGFTVSTSMFFCLIQSENPDLWMGSTGLANCNDGGINTLTKVGGGTFTLSFIDLAPFGRGIGCCPYGGGAPVTFIGTKANGATVSVTVNAPTTFEFKKYTFSGFDNVVKVTWQHEFPYHQFDNITLDAPPITYNLTTQSVGGVTVTGSFTTDGTLGPLSPSNITSSLIKITQGSTVFNVGLPGFPNAAPFYQVSATSTSVNIAPGGALSWCPNPPTCRPGFYIDETQTIYVYGSGTPPIAIGPAASPFAVAGGPTIVWPTDGAINPSSFVALSGTGIPGSSVDVLKESQIIAVTQVHSSGSWEKVVKAGTGAHIFTVRYSGNQQSISPPTIVTNVGSFPPPLATNPPFEKMIAGDVLLTKSLGSPQLKLYGPTSTHVALYLGGDSHGTPLIAESVTAGEAGSFGQVRSVALENSTVYTLGNVVDLYRRPDLSPAEKAAIIAWTLNKTSQNLSYWSLSALGGPFLSASFFWDFNAHQPSSARFYQIATGLMAYQKFRTDTFICSTLVWRAYYEGTNQRIDLSQPNNVRVNVTNIITAQWVNEPGQMFIKALGPYFVFPDTIRLSGKLVQVP